MLEFGFLFCLFRFYSIKIAIETQVTSLGSSKGTKTIKNIEESRSKIQKVQKNESVHRPSHDLFYQRISFIKLNTILDDGRQRQ